MDAILNTEYWGNLGSDWLIALSMVVISQIVLRTTVGVLLGRIKKIAAKTETDLDDLVAGLLDKTKFIFLALVSLWIGSVYLDLPELADDVLSRILVIGVLLQAAYWANAIIDYGLDRYKRRQIEDDPGIVTALGAIGFLLRTAVLSVILMMILANMGVEVGPLIASLGIGGLAIGLALKDVLGDLFASVSIIFDKPFLVGDFIQVGSFQGTVEHVGLKTTRLKSITGEQLVFNNSDLLGSRIQNYKRRQDRRITFDLGVTYDTSREQLEAIPGLVQGIIESKEATIFDRCYFMSFGDSALIFNVVYFMEVPDFDVYMKTQQAINLEIFSAFGDRGIEFAYPTQQLFVTKTELAS